MLHVPLARPGALNSEIMSRVSVRKESQPRCRLLLAGHRAPTTACLVPCWKATSEVRLVVGRREHNTCMTCMHACMYTHMHAGIHAHIPFCVHIYVWFGDKQILICVLRACLPPNFAGYWMSSQPSGGGRC